MSKRSTEDWLNRKWRPMVAVVYLVICVFDFILFPVAWAMFLHLTNNKVAAWEPLTLQGAGLFHAAFGAILGVSAFTRGQEKIQRVAYNDNYNDNYVDDRYSRNYDEPNDRRISRG